MSDRIFSFPPIIDQNSKILILGSVPGVKSLEMQQYYAHPQNKFWRILFEIFNENFSTDYTERMALLRRHGIALWDVIESCERKGSLDSEIKNEEAAEIKELLAQHPNIRAVFCNGQKSYKNALKIIGNENKIPVVPLASTSPAYAVLNFQQKRESWQRILDFI